VRLSVALPLVLVALAACTGTVHHDRPVATGPTAAYVMVDADKLCKLFTTDCTKKIAQSYDECLATYKAARVPSICTDAVASHTCDSPASELDVCFPTCTGIDATCDGDHFTQCTASGRLFTYQCDSFCATQQKAWSGICGTTYKTQVVPAPTCLCN